MNILAIPLSLLLWFSTYNQEATASPPSAESLMEKIALQQNWTHLTQELSLHLSEKKQDYQLITHMRREGNTVYCHAKFTAPEKVKGTEIVWIDRQKAETSTTDASEVGDEMWIYLPAVGRITTLKDRNKNRAFMGSDFQFEDFILLGLPQQHAFVKEESNHWIYQSTPLESSHIPYTSWTTKVNKQSELPISIGLYQDSTRIKELTFIHTNPTLPYPEEMVMRTLSTNTSTRIQIHSYDTQTEIPLELFSKERLQNNSSTSPQ